MGMEMDVNKSNNDSCERGNCPSNIPQTLPRPILIKTRGQAAMEYMVMLGFAIAIILPLWLYVNSSLSDTKGELDVTYARVAVNKIKDAADSVYVQGPPASIYLDLDMPDNIESTSVSGREVQISLNTQGGLAEIYAVSISNLQGSLPTRPGRIRVLVKSEGNYTNVTE
jgi:hypothetical protein